MNRTEIVKLLNQQWQSQDDLADALTAYAATVEREARIDEMDLLDKTMDDDNFDYHWPSEDGEYYDVNKYTTDRLAALQGPQEQQ